MTGLAAELERARALSIDELADAIESIGFECTRCGACCTREADDPHTATVFPDEVRDLQAATDREWRDVARPIPYGLRETDDGSADGDSLEGETFEWALQTDACGDCAFYAEREGTGACTVHADRPLVCRTYPFSVGLEGTSQPMGEAVDSVALGAQREAGETGDSVALEAQREAGETGDSVAPGVPGEPADGTEILRAHECEGLGRDISRADAEDLARALKERAVRELEEAVAVVDRYEPANPTPGEVVVHDSEGAKRPDGRPLEHAGKESPRSDGG